MRVIAAAVLLLAMTASAQVVDSHELIYGPFETGPRDRNPAIAVTVAPHGMLLAWSEIDKGSKVSTIHTGLLNFDGQLADAVHSIPATRATVNATTPAIATDGANFLLTWLERDRFSPAPQDVAGVLAGGTGVPLRGSEGLGQYVTGAPAPLWTGLDYRLFGTKYFSVSTDGAVSVLNFGVAPQRVPFANPDANGWVDWASARGTPSYCAWGCFGFPPVFPQFVFVLDWAVVTPDWIRSGQLRDPGDVGGQPVVQSNGDDLIVVWTTRTGLKAQRIDDGVATRSFTLTDPRAAQATLAMAGSLIVFEYNFDIYGTVLSGDSFGPVFPISNGADTFDTQPAVTIAGPNRYLVAYTRLAGARNAAIAGRFVTTTP